MECGVRNTEPINLRLSELWLITSPWVGSSYCRGLCIAHHHFESMQNSVVAHLEKNNGSLYSVCNAIYDPGPHGYWLVTKIASRGVCPSFSPISLVVALCTSLGLGFTVGDLLHPLVWRSWRDHHG